MYSVDGTIVQLEQALRAGLEEIAGKIETDAKATCPVRTGRLRASITHSTNPGNLTAEIGSEVYYAPFQEVKKHYLEIAGMKNSTLMANILADKLR